MLSKRHGLTGSSVYLIFIILKVFFCVKLSKEHMNAHIHIADFSVLFCNVQSRMSLSTIPYHYVIYRKRNMSMES